MLTEWRSGLKALGYPTACLMLGTLVFFRQYWAYLAIFPVIWVATHHLPTLPRRSAHACLLGAICFAGGTLYWMPRAIQTITGASGLSCLLIYLVAVAYEAIPYGLIAFGSPLRAGMLFALGQSGFHSLSSMSLGDALGTYAPLGPALSVIGAPGIEIAAILLSTGCFAAFERKTRSAVLRIGLAVVSLVAATGAGLRSGPANLVAGRKVLLVQPAIGEETIARHGVNWQPYLERFYRGLTEQLDTREAELIITPESGMPMGPGMPREANQYERWARYADVRLQPFLEARPRTSWLGVFSEALPEASLAPSDINPRIFPSFYTPATYLLTGTGGLVDRIPKRSLIPFLEYVPFGQSVPGLRRLFPWAREVPDPLARPVIQALPGLSLAPLICYDSLFRKNYWDSLAAGARATIVLTNDRVLGQTGAWYHYVITRVRAREYGIQTLFVGNYGFTGDLGQDRFLPWAVAGTQLVTVRDPGDSKPSLYARYVGRRLELVCILTFWLGMGAIAGAMAISFARAPREFVRPFLRVMGSEITLGIGIASALLLAITTWLAEPILVPTPSMQPALQPGQRVLVCKNRWGRIDRGSIVSFYEARSGRSLIKRIFLLPGDRYRYRGGSPTLNGQPLGATPNGPGSWTWTGQNGKSIGLIAVDSNDLWPKMDLDLEPGEYFVLGDRRSASADSRFFGPITRRQIVGSVCWPD